MLNETKTTAVAWARQLTVGIVTLPDVQAWADEQIAAMDEPPYWLIAVSMATRNEEVVDACETAPGVPDMHRVWAALMFGWSQLLEREPQQDSEIARQLYFMAVSGDGPPTASFGEMVSFWDAIDLAREDIHGDRRVERAKLGAFLRRWSRVEGFAAS